VVAPELSAEARTRVTPPSSSPRRPDPPPPEVEPVEPPPEVEVTLSDEVELPGLPGSGRSRALPLVVAVGLLAGVGVTVLATRSSEPEPAAPVVTPPGVERVQDAGPEVMTAAVVALPVDAGASAPAAVDAGAPLGSDAGAASPRPPESFEQALEDARAALVQQRYRTAIVLFRKASRLKPEDSRPRTGLGVALVMSDADYQEAIPYLKQGVADEPSNASAWLALGIAYQNLGRDAEAKPPYQEFLKLKPSGSQADEVRQALKFLP
jgi:hypothetical protein